MAARARGVLAALAAAVVLAACAGPADQARPAPSTVRPTGSSSAAPGATSGAPAPRPTTTSPSGSAGTSRAARVTKLLVVVEENHSDADALAHMPFLAAQARRFGRAADYVAATHPSLPNYLAIAGGSTFGVHDDGGPYAHPLTGSSVLGQVVAAGRSARTYAEGMSRTCQRSDGGRYAVKHNPWAYFTDGAERAACASYDVPAGTPTSGALHRDIAAGTLPTFGLLVPDLCHDAHDCPLATADAWLRSWLTQVQAGPDFRAGRLAVVVTFDEDDRSAGNHVLTVVVHPALHGAVVHRRLDHYALSATVSHLVGATPLRRAAGEPDLLAAFGLD